MKRKHPDFSHHFRTANLNKERFQATQQFLAEEHYSQCGISDRNQNSNKTSRCLKVQTYYCTCYYLAAAGMWKLAIVSSSKPSKENLHDENVVAEANCREHYVHMSLFFTWSYSICLLNIKKKQSHPLQKPSAVVFFLSYYTTALKGAFPYWDRIATSISLVKKNQSLLQK